MTSEKSNERKSRRQPVDMLNGKIWPAVLRVALPIALTSMLQQLFNAADIAVLGQFVGSNAMAAVGSNSPIVGLLVNLFVGISMGSNVVLSNYSGQKNWKRVRDAAHTAVLLSVVCGAIIAVLGVIVAAPMVAMLGVPDAIAPMAVKYLRIYFMGMPFIMLYNFESAIFRSQGDTRTPLLCLTIAGVLNVALNLFFVIVCKMDVDGVALATVSSNVVSSLMLLRFLTRYDGPIRIDLRALRIDRPILRTVLYIGIPSGLQGMVFSISNLIIQSAINSLGEVVIAGSAAAFNLEIFGFFILSSFGQANVSFIGQNYGAGNLDRCRRITREVLVLDELFTVALAGLLICFGRPLLAIFNGDPAVIEAGYVRVFTILIAEAINVVIEILSGSMRGYGQSMIPAIMTFIGICGVRILWVYTVFAQYHTWQVLLIAYPVSWFATMLAMIYGYFRVLRKVNSEPEHLLS